MRHSTVIGPAFASATPILRLLPHVALCTLVALLTLSPALAQSSKLDSCQAKLVATASSSPSLKAAEKALDQLHHEDYHQCLLESWPDGEAYTQVALKSVHASIRLQAFKYLLEETEYQRRNRGPYGPSAAHYIGLLSRIRKDGDTKLKELAETARANLYTHPWGWGMGKEEAGSYAKTDPSPAFAELMINSIPDQEQAILADIALNSAHAKIRWQAVRRLEDSTRNLSVLWQAAKNDSDTQVRRAARWWLLKRLPAALGILVVAGCVLLVVFAHLLAFFFPNPCYGCSKPVRCLRMIYKSTKDGKDTYGEEPKKGSVSVVVCSECMTRLLPEPSDDYEDYSDRRPTRYGDGSFRF